MPHRCPIAPYTLRNLFPYRVSDYCVKTYHRHLRYIHDDHRSRLSNYWISTKVLDPSSPSGVNGQLLLVRAGFVSPAYSGIYHLLPLGLRVQEKLEALVDKHMRMLNASKLALSSFSSETLWHKSGRLKGSGNPELFRVEGRKRGDYLLSPTHEEEITTLVARYVQSYKELPLRLYQTTRKYRNEPRPRQGLLRTREFVMNDLYTFDLSSRQARKTYQHVRNVYSEFFDKFNIPYLVAEASSGDIGGTVSHEYHFPSEAGEDEIVSCNNCDYAANAELAEAAFDYSAYREKISLSSDIDDLASEISIWSGVASDGFSLVNVFYPSVSTNKDSAAESTGDVNVHAIKSIIGSLNASLEDPVAFWKSKIQDSSADEEASDKKPKVHDPSAAEKASDEKPEIHNRSAVEAADKNSSRTINIYDYRVLAKYSQESLTDGVNSLLSKRIPAGLLAQGSTTHIYTRPENGRALDLLRIKDGDTCAKCSARSLKVQKAVELGHTFFLGTRYSKPLRAYVTSSGHSKKPRDTTTSSEEGMTDQHSSEKDSTNSTMIPLQMGCYGIGVSRMIGVVADTMADERGLNWPRVMAPFEVVVIAKEGNEEDAVMVYDALSNANPSSSPTKWQKTDKQNATGSLDVVLDDRQKRFISKLVDADLIGFPVAVILGRAWASERKCEVQCRRMGNLQAEISLADLPSYVSFLVERL